MNRSDTQECRQVLETILSRFKQFSFLLPFSSLGRFPALLTTIFCTIISFQEHLFLQFQLISKHKVTELQRVTTYSQLDSFERVALLLDYIWQVPVRTLYAWQGLRACCTLGKALLPVGTAAIQSPRRDRSAEAMFGKQLCSPQTWMRLRNTAQIIKKDSKGQFVVSD